ncbi:putative UspA domain-containing protein [Desulfamplus magnetovallimortis]|uniref:Putative UspA domain-containing protein n=1 Tax=Desulfamplus magnetovallimortis TaxID=1246637 RepID=A0A1W1HJB0_9BACT|nr:universal stress protein [Desulfamplus magnetovallimortis]SLM32526.1 putative UspA domain-containing protein [Desulfamplus magnetovallimortis]
MSKYGNTILVALDGSERAMKTVEYLCDFKPFHKKDLVLLNIFSGVPDCYWDLGRESFSRSTMAQAMGWEHQRRTEMEEFMARAKSMLVSAGYPSKSVYVRIQNRKKGVTRDIIEEAEKGYFALLSRRRGAGALSYVVMGSTTSKLVQSLSSVPLMLAGIERVNNSICVAVDGSENSRRAVDFTAGVVEGSDCRIVLCSVLRNFNLFNGKSALEVTEDSNISSLSEIIDAALEDAAQKFKSVGIPVDKIDRKKIVGVSSRAAAISQAAQDAKCDTVVLGRRGQSNLAKFSMGRVPSKVIHIARTMTVWIIS